MSKDQTKWPAFLTGEIDRGGVSSIGRAVPGRSRRMRVAMNDLNERSLTEAMVGIRLAKMAERSDPGIVLSIFPLSWALTVMRAGPSLLIAVGPIRLSVFWGRNVQRPSP